MKTCSTCKFYLNLENQCRKVLVTAIVATPTGQGQVVAGFPKVPPGWWCGAHETNPEALS